MDIFYFYAPANEKMNQLLPQLQEIPRDFAIARTVRHLRTKIVAMQ
jgi:hypothetical protein